MLGIRYYDDGDELMYIGIPCTRVAVPIKYEKLHLYRNSVTACKSDFLV